MNPSAAPPVSAAAPDAPDRDFAALQAEALADLRAAAAVAWTDHNPTDSGIALLEAALWAMADLHYRTASRPLVPWPLEAGLHRPAAERHWTGIPLPDGFAELATAADALADAADALAAGGPDLAAAVAAARGQRDAVNAVREADTDLDAEQALAVVRLLRSRVVLQAGLDRGEAIADALDAAGGDQTAATQALGEQLEDLWPEEIAAIVSRHTSAQRLRSLQLRADALRSQIGAAASMPDAVAGMVAAGGLSAEDAAVAVGLHPCPPGAWPEDWEPAAGETTHWPPHPLQARPVEPVTADDYARLARGMPDVRRAWVVLGALPGVGWDGQKVEFGSSRPGALTILIDPEDQDLLAAPEADQLAFLVRVLRHALSPPGEIDDRKAVRDADPVKRAEVDDPHAPFRRDLDRLAPRRLICDEVGAALLTACPITVRALLHAPVTADRDRLRQAAEQRLRHFLAEGRRPPPSAAPADCPASVDGPWPPPPPPLGGWRPGEAIRIAELVQVVADDPQVLGVEALEARRDGGAWQSEELGLDPQCIPVLAHSCLEVELQLEVGG